MKDVLSIINRKRVVGLYIGTESVDLVVLKRTLKGPMLIKFAQTYIYPKDIVTEEIVPESMSTAVSADKAEQASDKKKTRDDYIVEAIQRVYRESNIKPGNVVTAISSEDTMVRYFQMPKIPKQEWNSAINFEAKRYIPFRMEDVTSDFHVLQSKSSPNTMDVVFVAVKQNIIERFVALLERAGVWPVIIESASLSLIRAFNAAEQIDNKLNIAIVSIEPKMARINILRNGIPYIIRVISLSGELSEGGAQEPIFERLLAEIKLSFDFYEKQFPSEVIDKIIIYSNLPLENWHELVGKELQIPVEVGDPLRGIRIKKGMVPPRLAVSFGLALRGISKPFIDVNLFKERMLVYKRKELFYRMLLLESSAAIFLLIVLKVLSVRVISPLAEELKFTLSERPRVQVLTNVDSIDELERIKNKMEAEKDLLEAIISGRTYWTAKLAGFARQVSSNIWLTEVNFEEVVDKKKASNVSRYMSIKGYCGTGGKVGATEVINDFLINLKEDPDINKGMKNAEIISVGKTKLQDEEVASFEIVFTNR